MKFAFAGLFLLKCSEKFSSKKVKNKIEKIKLLQEILEKLVARGEKILKNLKQKSGRSEK